MNKPATRSTGPTHIAIYHCQDRSNHYYKIRLGRRTRFRRTHWYSKLNKQQTRLIHIEPIPAEFRDAIRKWLVARGPMELHEEARDMNHRILGSIGYTVDEGVAHTLFKFPKSFSEDHHAPAMRKATPGWGSHLEAACLRHLETQGVTRVATGWSPTESVQYVLNKAGLASWKEFPIREWIRKIEKYYRGKRREKRPTSS